MPDDLRYDYALYSGDRYVHNAMLTRSEAREHEAMGFRCVDVDAAARMGWSNLPRFRDRRYVVPTAFRRRWQGR